MSKFAAALKAHQPGPSKIEDFIGSDHVPPPHTPHESLVLPRARVGRPTGKRSDEDNTQVTAYVPAKLYYDVRIKLIERKRRDRRARIDFSDLLREWMEQWLSEQP